MGLGDWEQEHEQPRASDDEARRLNEKVKVAGAQGGQGSERHDDGSHGNPKRFGGHQSPEPYLREVPQLGDHALPHALRPAGEGVPLEAGAALVLGAQLAVHHDS